MTVVEYRVGLTASYTRVHACVPCAAAPDFVLVVIVAPTYMVGPGSPRQHPPERLFAFRELCAVKG